MNIKILLFFPKTSHYSPARDGDFIISNEYPGLYVYENRLLTVDEFNEIGVKRPEIFERDQFTQPIRIKIIEEPIHEEDGSNESNSVPNTRECAECGKVEDAKCFGDSVICSECFVAGRMEVDVSKAEKSSESDIQVQAEVKEESNGQSDEKRNELILEALSARRKEDMIDIAAAAGIPLHSGAKRSDLETMLKQYLPAETANP